MFARYYLRSCAVTLLVVIAGCASTGRTKPAPIFTGMGAHERDTRTRSPVAQTYFNQGLVWTFAFNHDEAIRSYQAALAYDDQCAMAWWGIAYCNGPHINNPAVDEAHARAAWDALQHAQRLAPKASPVEQDLIAALATRYADPQPADRRPLDEAYAAAMRSVWQKHRADNDVGTLYAESLMDLQPWDLWTNDGKPKGNTLEIVAVLEEVLARDPRHPGATHLYVHALEASPYPEKADAAATCLRTEVPASGHLVHMPAHIDVQLGRWSLAADQNVRAMEADDRYLKISPRQGFYALYMAHNPHFLAFASMMEGRREVALEAAREMLAEIPENVLRDSPALMDPYTMIELDVLMRFGEWDALLQHPRPSPTLPITTAFWHFARGIAYAAKGEVDAAERTQAEFRQAVRAVPPDAQMAVNPASKFLSIADHMLSGEIAYRRGDIDVSVRELREAIALEDELRYIEPPDWIQPVRHTLGAVLVSAKRYDEAEAVYRKDLEIWPENGWSLQGLAECLRAQGRLSGASGAEAVEQRFAKAWHRADTQAGTSCLCIPPETARSAEKSRPAVAGG